MMDYIIAQSASKGATVGSTSSASSTGSTVVIGSTKVSLVAGIAPEVVATSPRDLLEVPVISQHSSSILVSV